MATNNPFKPHTLNDSKERAEIRKEKQPAPTPAQRREWSKLREKRQQQR